MPGGGFREQVVQAGINVRDDLRASFASVSMTFRFSSGNTCRSFAPLTALTGHPASHGSGRLCMILAISGHGLSVAGLASADAVCEVSR